MGALSGGFTSHLNVLYFGSDAFSAKFLEQLCKINRPSNSSAGLCVSAGRLWKKLSVISAPELFSKSCIPVKRFCVEHGISHFEAPPKSLRDWSFPPEVSDHSFGVVVSFGYFIPKRLLDGFGGGGGIVNVHPSLLPQYRGAAPIIHAIAEGAEKSGVSIIELDPHAFDTGALLDQIEVVSRNVLCMLIDTFDGNGLEEQVRAPKECPAQPSSSNPSHPQPIEPEEMYSAVADRLVEAGSHRLARLMQRFPAHKRATRPQQLPEDAATLKKAPKIDRSFVEVCFSQMARSHVFNVYRAASHLMNLEAGMRGQFGEQVLKIVRMLPPSTHALPKNMRADQWKSLADPAPSGAVFFEKASNLLWIRCACAGWIAADCFKVVGKNHLFSAVSLVHGYHLKNFQAHLK